MSSLVVCSITPYPCVVCTQFADAHCCGCHHPRQCPFSVDFFLFLCIDNFFSANGVVVVGCVLLAPHTHTHDTHTASIHEVCELGANPLLNPLSVWEMPQCVETSICSPVEQCATRTPTRPIPYYVTCCWLLLLLYIYNYTYIT